MSQVAREAAEALRDGRAYEKYITTVRGRRMLVHDDLIAEVDRVSRRVHITLAGYPLGSRTDAEVRDRLNTLLYVLDVDAWITRAMVQNPSRLPEPDRNVYLRRHVRDPDREETVRVLDPDEWVSFWIPKTVPLGGL